jgi:hypothetical protein
MNQLNTGDTAILKQDYESAYGSFKKGDKVTISAIEEVKGIYSTFNAFRVTTGPLLPCHLLEPDYDNLLI